MLELHPIASVNTRVDCASDLGRPLQEWVVGSHEGEIDHSVLARVHTKVHWPASVCVAGFTPGDAENTPPLDGESQFWRRWLEWHKCSHGRQHGSVQSDLDLGRAIRQSQIKPLMLELHPISSKACPEGAHVPLREAD